MRVILILLFLTSCGKLSENVEKGNSLQEQILSENKAIHQALDKLISKLTGMNCEEAKTNTESMINMFDSRTNGPLVLQKETE